MGCSGNTPVENDDDIEDYDERYNFYNFKSKRKVKNPIPPSKSYPTKDINSNNDSDDDNNNNNKNKNKGKNKDKDKEDDESNNNTKDEKSKNNKKGDLYRNNNNDKDSNDENENKNNNKKGNPNGDIYDLLSDNGDSDGSDGMGIKKNKNKKRRNNNANDEDNNYSNIYMDDDDNNKAIFSDKGKTIPEYGVEENEKKKEIEKKEEEKKKNLKKSKINGITIVQKLKDYFPDDMTFEEIKNLVFEGFGDSVVEDMTLYIPGQTVTYEQAEELSYYIYNIITNKKNEKEKLLEELNVKIDLVPLDRKLIKEKMFKGQDPSDKQIENIFQSYGGESNDMKVLTIEFQ